MTTIRLFIIGAICFYLSYFLAEARKEKSKDVLKTVKTEGGVYDCVDFYKQPAFKHPLLQNHSYHPEIEPSLPNWVNDHELSDDEWNEIPVTKLNCPKGTVPIRRLDEADLRLQAQLRREYYSLLGGNQSNAVSPKIFLAMVQSKAGQSKTFHGIGSTFSIYNPEISEPEYSSAEVIIKGGNDVIIAGWTVNPTLYKDTQTRSFTYAVAGDLHCFNTACGFVQVDRNFALDHVIQPITKIWSNTIYKYSFFIAQDVKSGDWWLQTGGKSVGRVGYWPKKIFKGLSESGNYVACGGEAYGIPGKLGFPEMGFGIRPEMGTGDEGRRWPFCWNTKIVNEDKKAVIYDDFEEFSNGTPQYQVYYNDRDHRAIFGGPKHLN